MTMKSVEARRVDEAKMERGYFKHDVGLGMTTLLRRISAAVVAFASLRILMLVYGAALSEAYQVLLIVVFLLALIFFRQSASTTAVDHKVRFWGLTISTLWSWLGVCAVLLLLAYATDTSSLFSGELLLVWAVVAPAAIVFVQLALDRLVTYLSRSITSKRRAVIAGVNEHAILLAHKIQRSPFLGLALDGHFDDRGLERLAGMHPGHLLGKLSELPEYVRSHHIDLIYITLPIRNIQRVTDLLDQLHDTTASIYYVPDVFVFDLVQCRTDDIEGLPVVALCETPFYGSRGVAKRLSDFVLALTILLLVSPVLLAIAVAIKMTTPGTVLFKQRRYGLDGREITVYKFRTMYVSEDSDNIKQASRDDDRITPLGAFLRRFSLDELPQFINVLQGRMSVVGPRPHAVAHNEEYRKLIKGYMIRHKVNPGITGLAQVRGFRGETATVEDMRKRVETDLDYLRNWSLELDLKIILKTVAIVFSDKKAY